MGQDGSVPSWLVNIDRKTIITFIQLTTISEKHSKLDIKEGEMYDVFNLAI